MCRQIHIKRMHIHTSVFGHVRTYLCTCNRMMFSWKRDNPVIFSNVDRTGAVVEWKKPGINKKPISEQSKGMGTESSAHSWQEEAALDFNSRVTSLLPTTSYDIHQNELQSSTFPRRSGFLGGKRSFLWSVHHTTHVICTERLRHSP